MKNAGGVPGPAAQRPRILTAVSRSFLTTNYCPDNLPFFVDTITLFTDTLHHHLKLESFPLAYRPGLGCWRFGGHKTLSHSPQPTPFTSILTFLNRTVPICPYLHHKGRRYLLPFSCLARRAKTSVQMCSRRFCGALARAKEELRRLTQSSRGFVNLDISVYPCRTNGRTVDPRCFSEGDILPLLRYPYPRWHEGIGFRS
jgi:hypothetical protein